MSRQKYYSSYVKKKFIVGCEMGITEKPALGVSLDLAETKNSILISIYLLLPLSIKVDFIMFLILTTEVLMTLVTLKCVVPIFNLFSRLMQFFLEVFVNLFQAMNCINFNTKGVQ